MASPSAGDALQLFYGKLVTLILREGKQLLVRLAGGSFSL